MTVYEGWVFDGLTDLDFYPRKSEEGQYFLASIDMETEEITVWDDAVESCNKEFYFLSGHFEDWKNPTESELILFEIEFGFCYPSQSLLDQHKGGIAE